MIEALTLLISSVTLILQRKDRRTDRSPSAHLKDDLLTLHDAMVTWVEYMGRTNESVLEWFRHDKPKDDETGVMSLSNRQAVRHIRVHGQGAVALMSPGARLIPGPCIRVREPEVVGELAALAERGLGRGTW